MQTPLPGDMQHSQETDIRTWVGFEPAIPASKQLHTHVLEHTATGISPPV